MRTRLMLVIGLTFAVMAPLVWAASLLPPSSWFAVGQVAKSSEAPSPAAPEIVPIAASRDAGAGPGRNTVAAVPPAEARQPPQVEKAEAAGQPPAQPEVPTRIALPSATAPMRAERPPEALKPKTRAVMSAPAADKRRSRRASREVIDVYYPDGPHIIIVCENLARTQQRRAGCH